MSVTKQILNRTLKTILPLFGAGGNIQKLSEGNPMKKLMIISLFVALVTMLVFTPAVSQEASFRNQITQNIATDSAATNSITKYSQIFTMFTKTGKPSTSKNFLNGLKVLVTSYQANDSINSQVSLQVGQVSGGTLNKSFINIVIDTLTTAKRYIIIDLSAYTLFPECRLKVVGLSAGNGLSAVWNAKIGGVGKIYPSSETY
jgi:hypothetical protein